MIQAGQRALFQSQNQAVLDIRQSELDYFYNFYSNFGTQSALLLGFCLNMISQLAGVTSKYDIVNDLFFISTAVCFIFGMNCLLGTCYIIVFAPNLALHGPLGSMVRAVDGMLFEQDQVFVSFIGCLLTFAVSTVMAYWILMEEDVAITCTVITILGSGLWYHFTLRIYNRFKIHHVAAKTFEDDINAYKSKTKLKQAGAYDYTNGDNGIKRKAWFPGMSLASKGRGIKHENKQPLTVSKSSRGSVHTGSSGGTNDINGIRVPLHIGTDVWDDKPSEESETQKADIEQQPRLALSMISNIDDMGVEGYLTFRLRSNDGGGEAGDILSPTTRKYFTLMNGELQYFASMQDYRDGTSAQLNRPIYLPNHHIRVVRDHLPYSILLIPFEEEVAVWELQVDTIHELEVWEEGILKSIPPRANRSK